MAQTDEDWDEKEERKKHKWNGQDSTGQEYEHCTKWNNVYNYSQKAISFINFLIKIQRSLTFRFGSNVPAGNVRTEHQNNETNAAEINGWNCRIFGEIKEKLK